LGLLVRMKDLAVGPKDLLLQAEGVTSGSTTAFYSKKKKKNSRKKNTSNKKKKTQRNSGKRKKKKPHGRPKKIYRTHTRPISKKTWRDTDSAARKGKET